MASGTWKIVLQGRQISAQRVITLTVGVPVTTTLTVCKIPARCRRPHIRLQCSADKASSWILGVSES